MNKHNLYKNQYRNAKLKLKLKEDWTVSDWIDAAQFGVDLASIPLSVVPGANTVLQGINAGVDLAQGQYVDASIRGGLAALGLLPGASGVGAGVKTAATAKAAAQAGAKAAIPEAGAVANLGHAATTAAKTADAAADTAKFSASLTQRGRLAKAGAEPIPNPRQIPGAEARPVSTGVRGVERTVPSSRVAPPPRTPQTPPRPRPSIPPRTPQTPAPAVPPSATPKPGIGSQTIQTLKNSKTGLAIGAGAAATTYALNRYGQSSGKPPGTSTGTPGIPPKDEIPPEQIKGDRILTDVHLSRLIGLDPGEVTRYEKSQVNLQKGRAGEQFLPTFYMTPSQMANIRISTQAQRAAVPTYESFNGDMHDSLLKHKVKIAVNQYLKSKQGEDLNNHLNDVRKTLKTE